MTKQPTKLDNVVLEFANKVLDVRNGKENPTLGELIDSPKQAIYDLIEYVIGGDEKPIDINLTDRNTAIFLNNRVAFNNSLKSEQRKRAKELL